MKRTHPVPLASVLDDIMDSRRLRSRLTQRQAVALWPDVAGQAVAQRAQVIDIYRGTLRIRCHIPVLRQEILINSGALIARINDRCGAEVIKHIRFV